MADHEVRRLRIRPRALDRFVDEHAVRKIEFEVLLIEIEAVTSIAIVSAFIQGDGSALGLRVFGDLLEQLHLLRFVPRVARIVEPAKSRHPPPAHRPVVARLDRSRAHPRGILGKQLHPLVGGVAVRIQEDVGQPGAPDLRPDAAFRIDRIGFPLRRRDVDAERSEIPRMQHVMRILFLQIERELRAIGVGDRVNDDVHPSELLAIGRVGQEQLRQLQHVTGRRHFVRVLTRRIDDGRLHGRLFRLRPVRRFDRRHQIHGPDVLAEITLADLVDGGFLERRHLREHLVGFGRGNGIVELNDAPCRRHAV